MAAMTASDVTVTASRSLQDLAPAGERKMAVASIAFGDAALTYPSGGIPLPVKGQFGFKHQIDFCIPSEVGANGNTYKYDKTNHKLRIWTATATEFSGAIAASVVHLFMVGA